MRTLVLALVLLLLPVSARADALKDGLAAQARGDYKTALPLLQPLADQGNAEAQNAVGTAYREGRGVHQDDAQALGWFLKSANQGNARAADNLGLMYEKMPAPPDPAGKKKHGPKHNYAEAAKWFLASANKGDALGQCHAGRMYASGLGVGQNWVEAAKWLKLSASQGNPEAADQLGMIYGVGLGTRQDWMEAYRWYSRAAASSASYVTDRDTAAKNLTPAQIAAVDKELQAKPQSAPAAH
jgi:TPR repeat protein